MYKILCCVVLFLSCTTPKIISSTEQNEDDVYLLIDQKKYTHGDTVTLSENSTLFMMCKLIDSLDTGMTYQSLTLFNEGKAIAHDSTRNRLYYTVTESKPYEIQCLVTFGDSAVVDSSSLSIVINPKNIHKKLSKHHIAWVSENQDNVYFWNGSTVERIFTQGEKIRSLGISGEYVVWISGEREQAELFLWNGEKVTQLTDNTVADINPKIDNSTIIWERDYAYRDYDELMMWQKGKTTVITDSLDWQFYISGEYVLWLSPDEAVYLHKNGINKKIGEGCYKLVNLFHKKAYWISYETGNPTVHIWNDGEKSKFTKLDSIVGEPQVTETFISWNSPGKIKRYINGNIEELVSRSGFWEGIGEKAHKDYVIWTGWIGGGYKQVCWYKDKEKDYGYYTDNNRPSFISVHDGAVIYLFNGNIYFWHYESDNTVLVNKNKKAHFSEPPVISKVE